MSSLTLADFPAVAKQIVQVSDVRRESRFTDHSLVRQFSKEAARYYAVAGLIAMAIEPQKAGAVARKLLAALDALQNEKPGESAAAGSGTRRETFVEEFLKVEYQG